MGEAIGCLFFSFSFFFLPRSRLILTIRMMSSMTLLLDDLPTVVGRYSKRVGQMPCGRSKRPVWSEGASLPHKGVLRMSCLGRLVLVYAVCRDLGMELPEMRTNQDIQMRCCEQNCFSKVAPGPFGLGTCELI